jgi:hypothetical protein
MPWLDGVRHSESLMGNIWRWGWMYQNLDVCKLWQLGICLLALVSSFVMTLMRRSRWVRFIDNVFSRSPPDIHVIKKSKTESTKYLKMYLYIDQVLWWLYCCMEILWHSLFLRSWVDVNEVVRAILGDYSWLPLCIVIVMVVYYLFVWTSEWLLFILGIGTGIRNSYQAGWGGEMRAFQLPQATCTGAPSHAGGPPSRPRGAKIAKTLEHVLLDCPLWRTQRDLAWPEGATLAKQIWRSADEPKRTIKFIEDVGLNVW